MAKTTWGQRIRTWLAVTLITVLVWLYAEGQAVTERPEQIRVRFVAPPAQEGQMGIELTSPSNRQLPMLVSATLRGSTGQLAQVRQLTESRVLELELTGSGLDRPAERVDVVQDVNLTEALYRSELGNLGVSIVSTSPEVVRLSVEPLTTLTAPVQVQHDNVQVAGQVATEPSQARLTLPSRLMNQAENVAVTARLNDVNLTDLEPNTDHTVTVPLTIPDRLASKWTRVEPEEIEAKFTLRTQTGTITVPRLAVEVRVSPVLLRQYDIDIKEGHVTVLDTKLSGPANVLQRIEAGEIEISAWVSPTFEHLDTASDNGSPEVELPLHFDLPPDVTVISDKPKVPLIVRRKG